MHLGRSDGEISEYRTNSSEMHLELTVLNTCYLVLLVCWGVATVSLRQKQVFWNLPCFVGMCLCVFLMLGLLVL